MFLIYTVFLSFFHFPKPVSYQMKKAPPINKSEPALVAIKRILLRIYKAVLD